MMCVCVCACVLTLIVSFPLFSGVGLTFLFGFLLLVFSALVFFFGANAQKVCQALEGPDYPLLSEVCMYVYCHNVVLDVTYLNVTIVSGCII